MPPTLYLIDGHALAYRTYFAITGASNERLTNSKGEPTAGVFGFFNVLFRLIDEESPEYLAVAFDTGHTFRNQLFPEYKATRSKMPDDLRPQIERIRQLVDAFRFPRLETEGAEADDVLGSVARQAVAAGMGVKIITGDKDLLQLVEDRVTVSLSGARLADSKEFTPEDVVTFLGVRPDQVVDYKALVGDKSDNIPGVPGIGDKTAVNLLTQYGTLDEVYAHLAELPAGQRNKLEAGRELAYLSRDLAQIKIDVPVTLDLDRARTDFSDLAVVRGLFEELEFRTLMRRLDDLERRSKGGDGAGQQLSLFGTPVERIGEPPQYQIDVTVVDTPAALQTLQRQLESARAISLDTETTSTDPLRAELVGISLATEPGRGIYIPVGHRTGEAQLPVSDVLAALTPALTNPRIPKIGHNLKYDGQVLANVGLQVRPYSFDTMIAEWVVDPSGRNLGLKDMAAHYLDIRMTHIEDLIGKGRNQLSMADVAVSQAAPYAAADAEVTLRLHEVLLKRLEDCQATTLFEEVEMPLVPVLVQMEQTGIALDSDYFRQMDSYLRERMRAIELEIYGAVGYEFNLNSTQQLSKALFQTLQLEPPDRRKKTTSGFYSTSADVLEAMRNQHPVMAFILEYRELAKLLSTYVEALPGQINPRTGRVHTSFSQTGAVTGRLASSNPNLQNIPTRTEVGRRVRNGFIAAPGNVLLSVDYSQIELRIVAHMSGDEAMLDAFRAGQDIHATTASAIYNVPLAQVTRDMRRNAKGINFGLIYGISAFGLTRSTQLTLAESEDFMKAYFKRFPGVKSFLDGLRKQAAQQGYVETLMGRRRYFPNLQNLRNPNLRNREEREAINAPVQGTAADIMKLAMIHVPRALQKAGLSARVLLQVHDELLIEVSEAELAAAARVVRTTMEQVYPLAIPLETEARAGKTWGDLIPIEST
ncbi:MAG TPA: DNA polymerase I [Anaerolineaceae bacterium]|nr:DNA polymerase I [Anaerolineaceae bacterium]